MVKEILNENRNRKCLTCARTQNTHTQGGEKKEKKRAQRATSNVFAMFEQNQIQEFKEAFGMMDADKDGFISKDDLKDMYASLGIQPKEKDLDEMINEAPGPINFTMFITLFGDKVSGKCVLSPGDFLTPKKQRSGPLS